MSYQNNRNYRPKRNTQRYRQSRRPNNNGYNYYDKNDDYYNNDKYYNDDKYYNNQNYYQRDNHNYYERDYYNQQQINNRHKYRKKYRRSGDNNNNNNNNNNKLVADNYNFKALQHSMEQRARSSLRNVRDMNNWCKYVNITRGIRQAFKCNNDKKITILDLACGKGGDLRKFRGNKKYIKQIIGIDIASNCIDKAIKTYRQMKNESIQHQNASNHQRQIFNENNAYGQTCQEFFDEPLFNAHFECYNMNSPQLIKEKFIVNNKPFHLINIQFALHYSFKNKLTLNNTLNTINVITKTGSHLICSFVKDDIIINRLRQEIEKKNDNDNDNDNNKKDENERIVFKNKYQAIKMKQSTFNVIENIYKKDDKETKNNDQDDENKEENNLIDNDLIGIAYNYFQMDSVTGNDGDGVEEYLISFNLLCKLLWKYCKMKLIEKKSATNIYTEYRQSKPFCFGFTKRDLNELTSNHWTKDEKEVINTYGYAIFKKD